MEDRFLQTPDGQDIAGRDTARQGVAGRDEAQEDMVTYGNAGSGMAGEESARRGTARHAAVDAAVEPGRMPGSREPGGTAGEPGLAGGMAGEPGGLAGSPEPGLMPESGAVGERGVVGEREAAGRPGVTGEPGGLTGEAAMPGRERVEPMRPAGSAAGTAGLSGAPDDLGREPADLAGAPQERAGEPVAAPRPGAEPAGLDVLADTPLVDDHAQVQQRWQEIQSTFVDDPRGSVTRAADLADTVVQSLVASAEERKRALRGAWDGGETGTEELRNALRRYRVLIDRLSGV